MSENLLKLLFDKIETIEGAKNRALKLYLEIERFHGEEEARRIFAARAKEPTPAKRAERKNFLILQRYDNMEPAPNVMELARQLAEESTTLPGEEQITPRGSMVASTIEHHIRELKKKRTARIADGTWPWPWPSFKFDVD
jgi:hypothetical protein